MADYSHIQTDLHNGVLQLTFNRPKVGNALSLVMVQEIAAALEKSKDNDSVRLLLIRGAGKHFCTGGDIKDMGKARMSKTAEGDPIADLNRQFGA